MANRPRASGLGRTSAGIAVVAIFVAAGCEVENPGAVIDEALFTPGALPMVVDGLVGDVQVAHKGIRPYDGLKGGELVGTSPQIDINRAWQGQMNELDTDERFGNVIHRTLNIAEQAIERVEAVLGAEAASSPLMAEAALWAGFAYRMVGDGQCEAVFQGGAPQPRSVYHERAVERFTRAIEAASTAGEQQMWLAAHAGRAHSNMQLGNWQAALSDAGVVPDEFVFEVIHSGGTEREAQGLASQFQTNVRWTWHQWYADNFDDPRVRYVRMPFDAGDGSGATYLPERYAFDRSANVPVTKGWEMRLIEAEFDITQEGDWQRGLNIVNEVRAAFGQDPWEAKTQQEAFDALKKERAIMLWLEARRLGDLWRWGNTAVGDPLIQFMYEATPPPSQYLGGAGGLPIPIAGRAICFPLSITVRDSNPNIP